MNVLRNIIGFVLLMLLQLFLFNHLVMFHIAVPFVFVLFLYMLPLNTARAGMYLLAFGTGLIMDIFSDHSATGLHAFACLLAVSIRYRLAGLLSSSNFRGIEEINLSNQSSIWLLLYLMILNFVHHFCYFLLEDFTFFRVLYILWKSLLSTFYSTLVGFLIVFVFYKK